MLDGHKAFPVISRLYNHVLYKEPVSSEKLQTTLGIYSCENTCCKYDYLFLDLKNKLKQHNCVKFFSIKHFIGQ